jgi:uncharacterized membrane protein YesL
MLRCRKCISVEHIVAAGLGTLGVFNCQASLLAEFRYGGLLMTMFKVYRQSEIEICHVVISSFISLTKQPAPTVMSMFGT